MTTTAAAHTTPSGGGGMKAVPSARDLSRTDEGLGRAGPPSDSESGDSAADLPLNMLWAPDKGRGGEKGGWRVGRGGIGVGPGGGGALLFCMRPFPQNHPAPMQSLGAGV